jgi:glucose/arabinose dehydrogenase
VVLHPNFSANRRIYLSYAEPGPQGRRGAAVAHAQLHWQGDRTELKDFTVIWRQAPTTRGSGHYSHRLVFAPDGMLFITSGDRQLLEPAQDWDQNLGKIIRLNPDGTVPGDNPFQDKGELARTFWTLGHRNLLGIAFDQQRRLWAHEMGPRHGDELNLIVRGGNYGWPLVSEGNHYSGFRIPDHHTRPEFKAPRVSWVPTIAPSGLVIYSGALFPQWQGNALIGGLASESLIRVEITATGAREAERFSLGKRIREVEQGPDGAIYLLEDRKGGRLLRITPANAAESRP